MPALELFADTHNGKMVTTFLNAYKTYFTSTSISDENTKALFSKTRLSNTAHTWYNSQGYDETMVIFSNVLSYMLDYFIPSYYVSRAIRALVAYKMG